MSGLRVELLVWRLDRRLRREVPYLRRRAIRREVRANLRDGMRAHGEREAIRRLGDLDELAADYCAAAGYGPTRFRPERGILAAFWAAVALLVIDLMRVPTFGTVQTFDAHTGNQQWEWSIRYLWQFGGDARTNTLFEGTVFSPAFLLFALGAFVIGSRAWRLARH